jgi:CRP/FNR family transcriptional regulator, cyclic AMP receptor protein
VVQVATRLDAPAPNLLERLPFLQNLPARVLHDLAAGAEARDYEAGDLVCRQGELGDCLFIVERGEVEIFLPLPEGGRSPLVKLGGGRFFGEMAVIDDQPRSASAVALGHTRAWAIYREPFRKFLFRNPEAVVRLLEHLSAIIRDTNRQLAAARLGGRS